MSRIICDAALQFQADVVKRKRLGQLGVNFFGGEPTQAWDIMQYAEDRGRQLSAELNVPFFATCTTNAVLSEGRARWIAKHLSFALISLDGPPNIQNTYRPAKSGEGTHDIVLRTLRIFQDEGFPFALRCSVATGIVERIPEIVEYFCTEFRPEVINFEPLVMHGRCLQTGLQAPTATAFVNGIIRGGRIARLHGVELKLFTAQTDTVAQSPCGVSEDNFIVCPDGLVVSCYNATSRRAPDAPDFAIGEVDELAGVVRIDPEKLKRVRSYRVAEIPRCEKCFAKWHCAGGCRLYQTPPRCTEPPGTMCALTQRLTLWRLLEHLHHFELADRMEVPTAEACCV